MVTVTDSVYDGNRKIIVQNDNPEDGPTVYTPEEAEDLYEQLGDVL